MHRNVTAEIFQMSMLSQVLLQGREQASTKVALAVTQIQRMLPKARVVYCSATGVSDVKNMVRRFCNKPF